MEKEVVKRKLMIVVEDLGDDKFSFTLQGDIERLSLPQIPPSLYSAAEYWGLEFLKVCDERIKQGKNVKKLNREERRKG